MFENSKHDKPIGKFVCPECGFEEEIFDKTRSYPVAMDKLDEEFTFKCPKCGSARAEIVHYDDS